MPEKIDVLENQMADCCYFDVNLLVNSVTIVPPVGANNYLSNGAGNSIFQRGDSLRILSVGIKLLESFNIFNILANPPFVTLSVFPRGVATGNAYTNPNFSGTTQNIMMENYEIVIDSFLNCRESFNTIVPARNLLSENFRLIGYPGYAFEVSMLGVPAIVDGMRFYITPFVKVLHSIDLT